MTNAQLKDAAATLLLLVCLPARAAGSASAPWDLRVGGAVGFGAGGTVQDVVRNGAIEPISRSEGPGSFSLSLDWLLNERVGLGVEHQRNFRVAPFSSGVSLTGLVGRWYLGGPAPDLQSPDLGAAGARVLVQRISPFVGVSTGLAFSMIERENDLVSEIRGSGLYLGGRVGAEYPLGRSLGLRPEAAYSTTLQSKGGVAEYHLSIGFLLFL